MPSFKLDVLTTGILTAILNKKGGYHPMLFGRVTIIVDNSCRVKVVCDKVDIPELCSVAFLKEGKNLGRSLGVHALPGPAQRSFYTRLDRAKP
jgi:hypothetical protein